MGSLGGRCLQLMSDPEIAFREELLETPCDGCGDQVSWLQGIIGKTRTVWLCRNCGLRSIEMLEASGLINLTRKTEEG